MYKLNNKILLPDSEYISGMLKITTLFFFIITILSGCKKELKADDPITITYDQVYMVGSATSVQWDINSAIAMTSGGSDSNIFTWEGTLTAGEIKFPTAKSWSSDTFMAAVNGQSVTDSKAMLTLNGSPDQKWLLTGADAGNYKITLNTKDQTVTFQKQ